MKLNTKKKVTRIGNRFGKTEMSTAMDECPEKAPKPRRSIPMAEVNEMLDQQAQRLTRPLTPYDERLRLIREIEETEGEANYHTHQAKGCALNVASLQRELKAINQSIADELDFDAVR